MKSELEHSKENNDLLKKMARIIVEKYETKNHAGNKSTSTTTESKVSDESIEVLETEHVSIEDVDEEGGEFTEQLVGNRLRGFRRTTPSAPPQ